MSTTERLAQALREVLATLKRENERAEGPIKDTIWHGPAETLFDFIENTLGAHEAGKQAGPVAEHCPFKRCQDQGAHCNGACHGLMPDGKTPLAAVPELRDDVDEGRCLSCAGDFCTAGPFCVACSNPVAPPSPLTEQDKEDAAELGAAL